MSNNPAIHLMRQVEGLDQKTIDYLMGEASRLRKFPESERPKMGNPQPLRVPDRLDPGVVWVDNSWSRDEWVTFELMDATTGFVIVDNAGTVLARFSDEELGKAENAYQNSKINIQVDFDVPQAATKPGKRNKATAPAPVPEPVATPA